MIGFLEGIMKERTVSMKVQKGLLIGMIVLLLMEMRFGCGMKVKDERYKYVIEMSYLKKACCKGGLKNITY